MSLALFATLASMLPLGLSADSILMPDLLVAMTFAWVIRRPSTAPYALVFMVALFADIMLMRPLGLWAMLTLLIGEFARSQRRPLREQPFVAEWILFAMVLTVGVGINLLILNLTFTPRPSIDLMVNHIAMTTLSYPFVVAALHWIFRIRAPKTAAGSDRLGRVV